MNNIELKLIKEYVDKKVESGLPGAPGDSVVNVEKNQGNLIIYLSHYNTETGMNIVTPVNLGSIIGPQGDKGQHGDGYTSIQINNNGDLIATKEVYSAQGSTPASQQINLGHVVGTDYVLTNEDKAEIAESINLSSKQDKAPDGDNLLIDSSTGKINAAYIPDSLLGQIIFGGTISNVEADAGDDLVLRVALSATAKNILDSDSNYYTLYPHGPEYNAADCANMFFIYDSPQVNMSFDNIGVLNSGDWVISTGDAWQKIDNTDSVTSVNGKIGNVVLKTSDLQNDSGFLTQHQDISNKADKATTLAGYGITDAYKKVDINQMFNQVDADLQGKADKSNTYTKSEVDSLVSGGVVPQYVIDEAESVLAKAFAHKGLGRTIRFIAVSDSHNDATEASYAYTHVSNQHCGQAVKYIADRIPLDFVAFLGDMTWAGVAHTTAQYQTNWLKEDIQEMNMFLKDGFSGVPNIRVVGNHDQCATTDSGGTVSRLQNSGAYQYFGRYNAGVSDGLSNYGYYDLNNVKVRIIYLNTSDAVNVSSQGTYLGMTADQKNWLCETLIDLNAKTDAASWKILLMSHAPLDMISGLAADILIPYTNGGTYGSYTFTNHSAKIIGNCHGHTHCYNVGYISDTIRRFTIPNSNFYDNNHYKNNANYAAWTEETTYPKTQNSRTDTSFSLVTIDLDSLTCYVDNYGAGYDRGFSLDYNSGGTTGLLNMNRTEATAETNVMIPFDVTKYYKNISYGTCKGYESSCIVYSVTHNSISLKESGVGGITVGYVVEVPDVNHSYIFSCDYSGTGAGRIYYNYLNDAGQILHASTPILKDSSANTEGSVSFEIEAPTGTFKWLVIMFSAGTGGEKEYTNVSLEPAPANLFDKDDPDVILRARFNSSMQPVDFADEQLVTGFVPASVGTSFTIETDKANNTNGYTGFIMLYNSSKQPIGGLSNATVPFVWSSDYKSGTVTIPQSYINTNFEGTEYARFCLAYVDIDNIDIYNE